MLLPQIKQPSDVKRMSVDHLSVLAAEIRQFLIQKLAVTGGHLASNLGVVELTLALHYYYNSPLDKLIFDVGHQAYVHKILTGRAHLFHTLRKYKGLSGYIKRTESEHDVWEAGHSSTSLSAAMGMAIARDLKGEQHQVVAIVGDGALTGGMAFEALNHMGHEQRKVVVVLNDNTMSIAPNVGAMHQYFNKLRSDSYYLKAKTEIQSMLKKIPFIGKKIAQCAARMKDGVKYAMLKGVLFEELGFTYFGPIDGHNVTSLLETFRLAENVNTPVFIHVVTTKGKGYEPAEADSYKWHGISAYESETGDIFPTTGFPMYTDIFGRTLVELAEQDERIVAVTPAMPGGSGLIPFSKKFPDRMIDVGIAEQHAATMCAGLAMEGLKPVLAIYSTFMQRAYDQIVHDIARQNANVILAIDRAGFVGADGETHQGVYDVSFMRHIPNMVIMMPKDENELRHMMYTALQYNNGPIAYRYPRSNGAGVTLDKQLRMIQIGTWETISHGDEYAIIAYGPVLELAVQAAKMMNTNTISVAVINARFIKPLDHCMLLQLALKQTKLIVIEEVCEAGSLGSAIMEFYAQAEVHHVVVNILAIPDEYIEHGSVQDQRAQVGLTLEHLCERLNKLSEKSDVVSVRT